MDDNGKLSILLPAYNEEEHIFHNILEVNRIISSLFPEYEIIVINDGSNDNTYEEASRAACVDEHISIIQCDENAGKGWALRAGTEKATGAYIAFCDADLDLDPGQLSTFMQIMHDTDADAVIGSKMHPDSKVDYPIVRQLFSWGYYLLLLLLFRLNVRDTQTGLKLFRAEAIKPVMRKILVKRFAFDVEVLSILNKRHCKIESAPIDLIFRREAYGRIKWRDIYYTANDTLAVFYRLNFLHYYD